MFKNHLKIALRQLTKNKVFSTLNILGLSLGMALVILIAVFIRNEFSYDSWMTDSDRIYRVYRIKGNSTAWTPAPLAGKLSTDYPEVAQAASWMPVGEKLVTYAGNSFYVKQTAEVDSTFFEVLPLHFVEGDSKTALDQPNSMVLSEELAQRIFGSSNPIGEVLRYEGETDYVVTGILSRKGKQSHIHSDMFIRFEEPGDSWIGNSRATYVLLRPNARAEQLAKKIDADASELIRQEHLAEGYTPHEGDFYRWALQPLGEVYLQSEGFTTFGERLGSTRNIYIFGCIALLILAVAIINYVNLTTARSAQRSKEVGVKKVAGAGKRSLTAQFLTESTVQAVIASGIALLLAELCLPFFNQITNRELELLSGQSGWIVIGVLALALLTGLIAGSYPAFVLAAFQPSKALKSSFLKTGERGLFRKVLVTGQFAVSITLLIVLAFIYRQVNFMLEKDLGFKAEQVLTIPMSADESHYRVEELKSRFKQIPGVQEVTTALSLPGASLPDWQMQLQGRPEAIVPMLLFADADFAKTLDIELVEGRFIDERIAADSVNNFVVNEKFVQEYSIENPIGQQLKWTGEGEYGQIVGVVKNFHYQGLDKEIRPVVMNALHWRNQVGIKLSTNNLSETIAALEALWTQVEPNHPMRYSFLDEHFAQQYAEQQRFGKTILYATLLTVFIALLGLFGLTAFTVERRTREIGIRKVLGASVSGIVGLLAQDFMKLLGLAFFIALPLGYFLSNQWLADFAHRTTLAWWVFAGAGLVILGVAFLTISFQSIKAALANPVESLRSE